MSQLVLKTALAMMAVMLLTSPAQAQVSKPASPPPADSDSSPAVVPGAPPGPGMPTPPPPLNSSPATPKIVQEAVTSLQKTDPINLDDMVRAQDAINRLDLLLEIEKRQSELKKIRDERNKPTLTTGIPASALNLPRGPTGPSTPAPAAQPMTIPVAPPPNPISNYILKRIMGSEGRYAAVLDDAGKTLSVRPGETLPDGSKVKTVTLTSISIEKDKKSKTLTIPSDSYIVRGSEVVTQ